MDMADEETFVQCAEPCSLDIIHRIQEKVNKANVKTAMNREQAVTAGQLKVGHNETWKEMRR